MRIDITDTDKKIMNSFEALPKGIYPVEIEEAHMHRDSIFYVRYRVQHPSRAVVHKYYNFDTQRGLLRFKELLVALGFDSIKPKTKRDCQRMIKKSEQVNLMAWLAVDMGDGTYPPQNKVGRVWNQGE